MVAITAKALRRKLDRFDHSAGKATTTEEIQRTWRTIMRTPLSNASAKSFLQHYRDMTKKTSQRGGAAYALSGASTDYVMSPGASAFSPLPYGHFTDDVTADPSLLRQVGGPLEIFKIAQNADCGIDRYPTMAEARMAQVGAGRKNLRHRKMNRRSVRNIRKSSRKNNSSRKTRKSRKSNRAQQRGGNLLVALNPMNWTNPLGANSVNYGSMDKGPGEHLWTPVSNGTSMYTSAGGVHQYSNVPPAATITNWAPPSFK